VLTNKFGLIDKLTLLIAVVTFIFVAIFSLNYYVRTRAMLMDSVQTELKDLAGAFSLSFNAKEIEKTLAGTATSEAYWALKRKLNRVTLLEGSKITGAYILVPTVKKETWMFVADDELKNKSNMANLREEYDIRMLPNLPLAFSGATADQGINADKWGRWISGYAPIFDGGKRPIAILGIDLKATDIEKIQQEAINTALIYLLIGSILSLILGRLGAQTIISPIAALSAGAKDIRAKKYGTHINIKRNDELGELITAFNDMSDKIGEVDMLKSDFLAVISHELYTPLTPIAEGIDQLKVIVSGLGDDVKRIVAMIERQAKKLQGLVDEVLDFSWIDQKELNLNLEPLSLKQATLTAIEEQMESALKKKLKLEPDFTENLPVIMADKHRIVHVIKIMLSNAIKFSADGGKIIVKLGQSPAGVYFSVEDGGIGIAPENLEKVFDRFSRTEDHLTRAHGGVGLGLAIAKKIIEVHGGTIKAESKGPGLGSCFTFTLPLLASPPEKS
jgi:signal transduction histidine kinase